MVERRWRDNMTEWQRRRWLYRDGLRPLAEVDEQGAVQWVYVWGTQGNLPDLARGPHGELYRLLGDERGSLRLVVDTRDGRVVLDRDYNLLGQVTAVSGPTDSIARALPFGYEGGFTDEVTGLVRFGARWYDPRVGRWLSRDPLGFGGGDQNQYAFVHGDPVNRTDFNGMLDGRGLPSPAELLAGASGAGVAARAAVPFLANPGVLVGGAGVATGLALWGGVAYYLGPRVWNGLQSWLNQCPRPEASRRPGSTDDNYRRPGLPVEVPQTPETREERDLRCEQEFPSIAYCIEQPALQCRTCCRPVRWSSAECETSCLDRCPSQ